MLLLIATACSSDPAAAPSQCADIAGNYAVKYTRESGTCDAKIDGDGTGHATYSRSQGDTWNIVFPGLDGACPATLDASCHMVASCVGKDKAGAVTITGSFDYRFTASGYSGSTVLAYAALGCVVTYQGTANRL